MKYRALGNTGLLVSELVIGTVPFGGRGAFEKTGSVDVALARRMFDMAFDVGVNLVDTADLYSHGLAEEIVGQVDNVQGLVNELSITASPSLTQQANDTLITGKVKAGLVDVKDLSANAFKVVTERGSVYLMGRVTQREADQATEVARNISGVTRVVRVLEIISPEELRRIQAGTAAQAPVENRPMQ